MGNKRPLRMKRVEQHTGYYPYGEPWREPSGQPYLFGSKERRGFASLHDSDFHARFLTTATALWQAPDPHAGKYPWLSPWMFCAANPVRFRDPSGKDIYEFNRHGDIIERIKIDDYDMVRVVKDGEIYKTSQMPARTIKLIDPKDRRTNNVYMSVRGDENSTMVFELLADNTDVEYSHIQAGQEGSGADNYVTTSHSVDEEAAGINVMDALIGEKKTIRSHTHNHPALNPAGPSDIEFAKHYSEKTDAEFKIYHKGGKYYVYY